MRNETTDEPGHIREVEKKCSKIHSSRNSSVAENGSEIKRERKRIIFFSYFIFVEYSCVFVCVSIPCGMCDEAACGLMMLDIREMFPFPN